MTQPADTVISEGITTLRNAIAILPKDRQDEFAKLLDAIEARFRDKDFYLAVIGCYNAGKSTFLNALLRTDILSAGDFPTTAIPTYIRWNRHEVLAKRRRVNTVKTPDANLPCIQVEMTDGKKFFVDGLDNHDLKNFQARAGIELPRGIEAKVDFLTTSNSLAGKIVRIYLSFPEREGFGNLCIIETPGIDMGDAIVFLTKMDIVPRKEWDRPRPTQQNFFTIIPIRLSPSSVRYLHKRHANIRADAAQIPAAGSSWSHSMAQ